MKNFLKSRTIQGAIIAGLFLIAATLLTIYFSSPAQTNEPVANIALDYTPVRKLEPLETGKYIGKLPDGIYGFGNVGLIVSEITIRKPWWETLVLSSRKLPENFELQKRSGKQYLIGFVGSETFSRMGEASNSGTLTLTLSPRSWSTLTHSVEIPLDKIDKAKIRPIDIEGDKYMYVLDMDVKKINSAASVHSG